MSFKIEGLILIASISCLAISFVAGLPTICSFTGTVVPLGNSSATSSKDLFLRNKSTLSLDSLIIEFISGWDSLTLSTSCIDFLAILAASFFLYKAIFCLFLINILVAWSIVSFVGLYFFKGFNWLNNWYSVVRYPPIWLWIVFDSSWGNPLDSILDDILSTLDLKFKIAFFNGSGSAPVLWIFFKSSSNLPPLRIE